MPNVSLLVVAFVDACDVISHCRRNLVVTGLKSDYNTSLAFPYSNGIFTSTKVADPTVAASERY